MRSSPPGPFLENKVMKTRYLHAQLQSPGLLVRTVFFVAHVVMR